MNPHDITPPTPPSPTRTPPQGQCATGQGQAPNELIRLESASQLRAMLGTIPDLIWLKNTQGVYLYCNKVFEEFVGRTEAEILGKTDYDLFDASLADFFRTRDRIALEAGKATQNEEWLTFAGSPRQGLFETVKTPMCDADGSLVGILGVARDVTERKRAEEALEKRMLALTRPLGDVKDIAFEDLFRIEDIQRLQDEFSQATGVASLITKPDGTPITRPSNFCRFCSEIVRKSPKGLENCMRSDARLGRASMGGPTMQQCLSGGLWDAGAGITVGGLHVASWLVGQVREPSLTEAQIRDYARAIDVDEDVLVSAFQEIPDMPLEKFQHVARVLYTLANQLSAIAYQNVQQARVIVDLQQAEAQLRTNELHLRSLVTVLQHEAKSPAAILSLALEAGIACSGSARGWVKCLDLNGDLAELTVALPPHAESIAEGPAWREAASKGVPVLENHCVGDVCDRQLVIPVHCGGRMVALAGLSGKKEDYVPTDSLRLCLLMDSAWKVLEQRRAEEALRAARDDLERQVDERTKDLAQKARELEAANASLRALDELKSNLMNTVSHELRTPLTSMYGFVHLIRKEFTTHVEAVCQEPPQLARRCARIKDNLDIIESEGRRLGRMINDFLDLSKIESGRMAWNDAPLSPWDVVSRAVRLVRPSFEEKGEIALALGDIPKDRCLNLDEDRLVQVLVNLLDNACKHTMQGSVTLAAEKQGGWLSITVADTGRGIPEQDLERVFDTFYQSHGEASPDELAKGTGLGLAICKQIVTHYGGSIWATSTLGQGSVFHVRLPLAPETLAVA